MTTPLPEIMSKLHPNVARLLNVKQYAQRSEEWDDIRKGLLTASDVASALDIKPYETFSGSPRLELLKKKVYPERFPFVTNKAMQYGIDNEDSVRIKFEEKTGEQVLEFGLVVHPTIPWLAGTI